MSAPTDSQYATAKWVAKAESDFVAASHLPSTSDDASFEVICFHCQQCIEKHVKALWTDAGIPFPKIHDIAVLSPMLPAAVALPLSDSDRAVLTL